MTVLTKHQVKKLEKVFYENGQKYIYDAEIRYDDRCNNGHNSFSITGTLWQGYRTPETENTLVKSALCTHDIFKKCFPKMAHLLKWHLCSTDGPMQYVASTIYHASDKDHNGLRKGETRQLKSGKTGLPCWILTPDTELPKHVDSETRPTDTVTYKYEPWLLVGKGKERDLDAARSCACWPDAPDEVFLLPEDELKAKLQERLPALMDEFKKDIESLGFVY